MNTCKVFFLDVSPLSDKELFAKFFNRMSDYRQKKIMAFVRQEDRNLSLGAGVLTDVFLKEYGLREKDMEYGFNQNGKPCFPKRKDICFNLSHSGIYAMAVSASQNVGCDIEEDKKIDSDISAICLNPEEEKEYLLKYWTIKESYLKKEGCGLNCDLTKLKATDLENVYLINDIEGYWVSVCTQNPSELIIEKVNLNQGEMI